MRVHCGTGAAGRPQVATPYGVMSSTAMLFKYWFDPTGDSAYREYLEESSGLREQRDQAPGTAPVLRLLRIA